MISIEDSRIVPYHRQQLSFIICEIREKFIETKHFFVLPSSILRRFPIIEKRFTKLARYLKYKAINNGFNAHFAQEVVATALTRVFQ